MTTDPATGQPIPDDELKKWIAMSASQPPQPAKPSIPSPNAIPPAPAVKTMPAVTTPISASPSALPPQPGLSAPPKPPQTAWQKLGHGLRVAGNVAGDVIAPNTMALIPGTDMHKELEQNRSANLAAKGARTGLENAQADMAREGGQLVPFTDSQGNTQQVPLNKWGPLEIERERAAEIQKATETKGQTARDVAGTNTESREKIATQGNETKKEVAGQNVEAANSRAEAQRENQFKIAQMRDNLENIISGRRESTQRDIATQEFGTPEHDLGAAPEGKKEGSRGTLPDGTPVMVKGGRLVVPGQSGAKNPGAAGGKLGAQNQNRAEFAKTVIEQIPNINSEIDALADKLGPGAGRWNDFWVKKVGANDPDYAALDQDLGLFASAVAVTHFGARGGGQHFIEALKKDFGQAQSPEDLKARIKSADKWLTGYANMGQQK